MTTGGSGASGGRWLPVHPRCEPDRGHVLATPRISPSITHQSPRTSPSITHRAPVRPRVLASQPPPPTDAAFSASATCVPASATSILRLNRGTCPRCLRLDYRYPAAAPRVTQPAHVARDPARACRTLDPRPVEPRSGRLPLACAATSAVFAAGHRRCTRAG